MQCDRRVRFQRHKVTGGTGEDGEWTVVEGGQMGHPHRGRAEEG